MSDSPEGGRRVLHGRRRGRPLRHYKRTLLETLLPALAIERPPPGTVLDPRRLFARPVDAVWLEIGFGSGEHLAAQATAHPETGMIGCEPFVNGIANLLRHIEAAGLDNIRILPDDARLLMAALPDASIGRCFVLFPDPWPKARHHKRRFIGPATLDRLARVLDDEAELRLASDDMGLARWMLEHTWRHPAFEWLADRPDDWRRRPDDGPPTRYETKALEQGRRPVYLRFRRRPRTDVPARR